MNKKRVMSNKFSMYLDSLDNMSFILKNRDPRPDELYYVYEDESYSSFAIIYRVTSIDGAISYTCNTYHIRVYFEDVDDNGKSKCKHLNKRYNVVFKNILEFWYCPDCKEDVK